MNVETFSDDDLPQALAAQVAGDLKDSIGQRGRATIAVPGGSTPSQFLKALSEQDLDWTSVWVTLTDERAVPVDDARSNQGLIGRTLLQGVAKAARFIPLYDPQTAIEETANRLLEVVLPLDVCVLGMGTDMHTASLFPDTPGLAELLDPASREVVAKVQPPDAPEARITLTNRALSTAANTYLLIKGQQKREALERALVVPDFTRAPIRAILETAQSPRIFCAI